MSLRQEGSLPGADLAEPMPFPCPGEPAGGAGLALLQAGVAGRMVTGARACAGLLQLPRHCQRSGVEVRVAPR